MITTNTHTSQQCVISTGQKDIASSICTRKSGDETVYELFIYGNGDTIDRRTIPCIIEFRNKDSVDALIKTLKKIKRLISENESH